MHDAIVIGSGIGGMTAAGLLARVANKRVLVLEKHSTPGGQTHVFRRDGAAWDVGLHYVGSLENGTILRNYFDFLSGGQLQWNRMPERFDRFVCPGLDFSIPSEETRYRQELIERFPDEAAAIRRYFRDIHRSVRWMTFGYMRAMVPAAVVPVLRLLQWLLGRKTPLLTTGAYLDRHFRSPQLKSLLASQWGDYGIPPDQSAFGIHAMIVTHFLGGAWFPEGGSGRIARSFESGIEASGGAIRVSQEVTRILIENGRAVGVEARDWRLPGGPLRTHRAPIIISDIGARLTYEQLLPTDGPIGERTANIRALINDVGYGCSAVSLYLRLKDSIRTLGIEGENIWVNAQLEHPSLDVQGKAVLAGKPCGIFVSFPSIKAGDEKFHTAEIISFIDIGAFARWQHQAKGQRDANYLVLKTHITEGLLNLAESAIPGLRALVSHAELGTPLSVMDYTSHPQGCFYGLPATPERLNPAVMTAKTPIPGLLLAGQDVTSCGIAGAMMGGVSAACSVLGSRGYPMIQAAMRKMLQRQNTQTKLPHVPVRAAETADQQSHQTSPISAQQPARQRDAGNHLPDEHAHHFTGSSAGPESSIGLPEGKHHACLEFKKKLTDKTWLLRFRLADAATPFFAPGQFARIQVAPLEWRDYSIVSCADHQVEFLISTHTGGEGSRFVQKLQPGDRTLIELPLGRFLLDTEDTEGSHSVFVATGTGIAPFLPMFAELENRNRLADATLLFGCRTADDDLSQLIGSRPLPGNIIRCYSRAEAPRGGIHARVTHALEMRLQGRLAVLDVGAIGGIESVGSIGNDNRPPDIGRTSSHAAGMSPIGGSGNHDGHGDNEGTARSGPDLSMTNFYLCGHPAMIQDASALLGSHGVARIHVESY